MGAHKHNVCQPPSFPFGDRVVALVVWERVASCTPKLEDHIQPKFNVIFWQTKHMYCEKKAIDKEMEKINNTNFLKQFQFLLPFRTFYIPSHTTS